MCDSVGMKKRNRIYLVTPVEVRFFALVEKTDGCWFWKGAVKEFGHGVMRGQNGRTIRAHRASWEIHKGPIPSGLFVCHHCDVPNCVNPDHLFLGTNADNMADCKAKGRARGPCHRGEKHGMSRLTEDDVRELRDLHATGQFFLRNLADRYGITIAQAHRIVHRRAWRHVA